MIRLLLLVMTLAVGLPGAAARAQADSLPHASRTVAIMGVPQYLLTRGVRLDVEYRPVGSRHALVVAPQGYYGTREGPGRGAFSDDVQLDGWGVEVQHKLYTRSEALRDLGNFYFTWGAGYHRFRFRYEDFVLTPVPQSGDPPLLQLEQGQRTVTNQRVMATAALGSTFFIQNELMVDLFLGFTVRAPFFEGLPPDGGQPFADMVWEYNFRGVSPYCGVKFGLYVF
ncbi:MAG: hypothetical protein WBA12_09235 [Catalinimonas sp.]